MGNRMEKRQKMNCDAVSTKASADLQGCSEAEMAPHNCPKLKQRGWMFAWQHIPAIGRDYLMEWEHDLGWGSPCSQGQHS